MSAFLRFDGAVGHQPQIDAWFDEPEALPDTAPLKALVRAAYADIKARLAAAALLPPGTAT